MPVPSVVKPGTSVQEWSSTTEDAETGLRPTRKADGKSASHSHLAFSRIEGRGRVGSVNGRAGFETGCRGVCFGHDGLRRASHEGCLCRRQPPTELSADCEPIEGAKRIFTIVFRVRRRAASVSSVVKTDVSMTV